MKKICIVLLAMLLMLTVGCKKEAAEPANEPAPADAGATVGGWTPAAEGPPCCRTSSPGRSMRGCAGS